MARHRNKIVLITATWVLSARCFAGEVQVAVATNFAEPVKAIAVVLEKTTGHKLMVTLGATGKLYAQIKNGAPFDMLLSADSKTSELLEKEGLAQPGSRFTYATGKLVLWSADARLVDAKGDILKRGQFRKIAYATPKL
ncbi:MAG: molybdate ABC transporter substrate-binding protein, partial [Burkholderiaceae bacterium]